MMMNSKQTQTTLATSSGVRFGTHVPERRRHVDIDREAFLEKFPAFGLTPDFFNMGMMDDDGNFCQLKGFDGNCAIVEKCRRRNGKYTSERALVPFEYAVQMMLNMAESELDDVKGDEITQIDTAGFCFDASLSDSDKATKRELMAELKERIETLENALTIYNGYMDNVAKEMGLPYRCGCKIGDSIFEFVSYREDNIKAPYVLENISRAGRSKRFSNVSFQTLLKRAKTFANEEDCTVEIDFAAVVEMSSSAIEDVDLRDRDNIEDDGQTLLLFA